MKEIKFRAWNGSHLLEWGWICAMGIVSHIVLNKENNYQVMQYTGLHDKNGKEIYESDIVYSGGLDCTVKWEQAECRYRLYRIKRQRTLPQSTPLDNMHKDQYQVIGNIYSNPKLLEK